MNNEGPKGNDCECLLLGPLQKNVRITYQFLKAYWNSFLTTLYTASSRECFVLSKLDKNTRDFFTVGPIMNILNTT